MAVEDDGDENMVEVVLVVGWLVGFSFEFE